MRHLVDDAVGDDIEHIVWDLCPVCGHAVDRGHGADGYGVVICPLIAHDADGTHIGQAGEVLPDLFLQAGLGDLLAQDGIRFSDDVQLFFGDVAQDADTESRAGERLSPYHFFRQTKLDAQRAHFVLEQRVQRLDELELHVFRQAADIVMRLDRLRGLRAAFDDISIQRALCQPLDVLAHDELLDFLIERIDEFVADDLALLFRIADAGQLAQETVFGIDLCQVDLHVLAEHLNDALGLAFAQQTMIDEHAVQLRADGLMQQRRHDAGIHAAGQCQQHLVILHLRADLLDLRVDEIMHGPVGFGLTDLKHEVFSGYRCHRRNDALPDETAACRSSFHHWRWPQTRMSRCWRPRGNLPRASIPDRHETSTRSAPAAGP